MTGVTPSSRGFLEPVAHLGRAEVGLVLLDRFALVVEDGLAVGDPAQGLPRFLGFRLDFLHHHAAHAVGVFESGLQWALFARCQLADVLLAQNAAGAGGMLPPANYGRAIQKFLFGLAEVIDVPGGGVAQPRPCLGFVVRLRRYKEGDELFRLRVGQGVGESCEVVAFRCLCPSPPWQWAGPGRRRTLRTGCR